MTQQQKEQISKLRASGASFGKIASVLGMARQWLGSGLVTEEDYKKIDTITAEKFGVSARSIWRDINLIKLSTDGNMPPTKGDISSGKHHSSGSADEAG